MKSDFYGILPFGAIPSENQIRHFELGKKAFFHFGVNTFSNKEWGDGNELEQIFNPTDCDVRSWIRDIKGAGFKLAIITAKHHDGFCLWPSSFTKHSVKNSPYKNGTGDIIKEFTDACHEYNIKVGIYISPWDRHASTWGTAEYSKHFADQLTELVTQYGKIDEIWWDGAGSKETPYDWGRWAYIIKKHQPNALIFGSMGATPYIDLRWVGNEAGFAGKTHYASINEDNIYVENVSFLNSGEFMGERYIPAEVDVSIRPGWFYHEDQDDQVKSPLELDEIWFRSVGNNAMMLLNFPPNKAGRLFPKDVQNAIISNRRIEKMLSVNFLVGSKIKTYNQYCANTDIYNAVLSDDDLFYASSENKAIVDIVLPENTPEFNVIILGEKVELGERITEFTLECLDSGAPEILARGTSVGYLRALKFKSTKGRNLRLTIVGAVTPITLRKLSLNVYDNEGETSAVSSEKQNLAELKSAELILSENEKRVQVMFGGIYPFDTISFMTRWRGKYKISAFDGSKYYCVAEGDAKQYRVTHKLNEPIRDSYQVMIECEKGFALEPEINIQ